MTTNESPREDPGLQFFGTLSAAVSHDLKNVLSIINEKAGLLEDFCLMAQRGRALDVARIDAITAQVKGQVERADRIIRSFNRFAHSADHPIAATDLGEAAATLVQLAQRLLAGMQVAVSVTPAEPPVVIATRPLLAQELIWSGLQWAAAHLTARRELVVTVAARTGGAEVQIGPLAPLPAGDVNAGFLESTRTLRETLNAQIVADAATATLQIQFAPLATP